MLHIQYNRAVMNRTHTIVSLLYYMCVMLDEKYTVCFKITYNFIFLTLWTPQFRTTYYTFFFYFMNNEEERGEIAKKKKYYFYHIIYIITMRYKMWYEITFI